MPVEKGKNCVMMALTDRRHTKCQRTNGWAASSKNEEAAQNAVLRQQQLDGDGGLTGSAAAGGYVVDEVATATAAAATAGPNRQAVKLELSLALSNWACTP